MRFTPLLQGAAQSGSGAPTGTISATQALNVAAFVGTVSLAAVTGTIGAVQGKNVFDNSGILASIATTQTVNTASFGGSVMNPQALPAGVIVHFDADTITPAADNSNLASWTDSVGGFVAVQATSANQPRLRTNRINGKQTVQLQGSQWFSFDGTGALKTAVDSQNYSVLIAFANGAVATNGVLFGNNVGGNAFAFFADGVTVGRYAADTLSRALPWASQAYAITGMTSTTARSFGGLSVPLERNFLQGMPHHSTVTAAPASGSATFTIGAMTTAGLYTGKADVTDIVVFDHELTPADYLRAEISLRQKSKQPLPWGGYTRIEANDGDSITVDINTGKVSESWPYLLAQSRGLPYGTWANYAIGGIRTTQNTGKMSEWTDALAVIGLSANLNFWEWVNGKTAGRTPAQLFADNKAYCVQARTLLPSVRINLGSSTAYSLDGSDPYASVRGVFNGLMDDPTTGAISFADAYTKIHLNQYVGTSTSYATYSATYFEADGTHIKAPGLAEIANEYIASRAAMDLSSGSFGVVGATGIPGVSSFSGAVSGPVGTVAGTQAKNTAAMTGTVVDPAADSGTIGAIQAPTAGALAGYVMVTLVGTIGASGNKNSAALQADTTIIGAMGIIQAMNIATLSGSAALPEFVPSPERTYRFPAG